MKENIRKEIKEKRRNMCKEENRKKSKEIKEKLFNLREFKDAETILFYVSYNGEVFTHEMIREAMSSGKKIVVPISNKKDYSLILSELTYWDDLDVGSYGIMEPKKDCVKEVSIDAIDLIIVPGVGFDTKGNRLGHGKGYYDKLLEKSKAVSIALAFEFQVIDEIPIASHDMSIGKIITEERILDCSK